LREHCNIVGMKKLVVLSGAGISAESGIPTFRGSDGLWEGHRVEDVASPEGWQRNRALVLDFYNQRRKAVYDVKPNRGHEIIAELQSSYEVTVVTQNIDDLHERAGSKDVVHLHGEIKKVRSTSDDSLVYDLRGWELKEGDLCEKGSQLRPHIVWFGEEVPMMDVALSITMKADIFLVIGTSLAVYPAAGLVHYAPPHVPKFIVDPNIPQVSGVENLHAIEAGGQKGMQLFRERLAQMSL
jgi:NAD-dependent deacetylase